MDAFKAGFTCVALEFFVKNMGNPYYEPTIVVHDLKQNLRILSSSKNKKQRNNGTAKRL